MEQVKLLGFNRTIAFTLVLDSKFYDGKTTDGIHAYFRMENTKLTGKIQKPTGKKDEEITVKGEYSIQWQETKILGDDKKYQAKYYIVSI